MTEWRGFGVTKGRRLRNDGGGEGLPMMKGGKCLGMTKEGFHRLSLFVKWKDRSIMGQAH
jgi:hypothetical protein